MRPTVFVVDDDASVLSAVGRLIGAAGHKVETFSSPREFFERARSDGPGCLVVDLRMPELTGLQLQEAMIRATRAGESSTSIGEQCWPALLLVMSPSPVIKLTLTVVLKVSWTS